MQSDSPQQTVLDEISEIWTHLISLEDVEQDMLYNTLTLRGLSKNKAEHLQQKMTLAWTRIHALVIRSSRVLCETYPALARSRSLNTDTLVRLTLVHLISDLGSKSCLDRTIRDVSVVVEAARLHLSTLKKGA
jgi:hypothetical protein